MIVTDLIHAAEQFPAAPAMQQALAYLQEVSGKALEDGRVELDGDKLYALIQSYETLAEGAWKWEGHRRYIDIQYVAAGEEVLGWAPAESATITTPYNDAKDAWLGTVPQEDATPVKLVAGQLAVFYPSDAHAPKRAAGAPSAVKKIVIKVAVDQ